MSSRTSSASRTRTIALCGLSIALLTVSAWITIPLGPIPFTLQTFMLVFLVLSLTFRQSVITVFGYLLLGALGAPVFAGFKGGLGALMGPTGGFLIGFGIGTILACYALKALSKTSYANRYLPLIVAATIVVGISYLCGWIQLMVVADLSPAAAFVTGIAPFILLDAIKSACAIKLARVLCNAVPALRKQHN